MQYMRIISGFLKGRNITGYNIEGTRPTMDRVRESLFSIIQNNISNSVVLDLFSGSGILGLESISNGSKYCYFNDINIKCVNNIKKLIKDFNIENKCYISNLDYKKALELYKHNNIRFSIIFLDPPYNMDCINDIINFITDNKLLEDNGLIICEVDNDYLNEFKFLELIKYKKYGNKFIYIYKKTL